MISCIAHKEIDERKWDACIAGSSTPLVYGTSWFLDIVSPGWDALVMNDYEAVFPLTHNRKYGFAYLRQPFFCQQLGVFSKDMQEETSREFLDAIPKKYKLLDINLNTGMSFPLPGFHTSLNLNLELPLQKSHPELYKYFSDHAKRNIQKANAAGFTLTHEVHINELIQLFIKNKGQSIRPFPGHAWEKLRSIVNSSMNLGLGEMWVVSHPEHGLCAGAFFLKSVNRFIFLFSALSEQGRKSGAMYFLLNEFISRHSSGNKILDFEGSKNENLARFYKGFGSVETHYLGIWKNNLPVPFRFFKKRPGF